MDDLKDKIANIKEKIHTINQTFTTIDKMAFDNFKMKLNTIYKLYDKIDISMKAKLETMVQECEEELNIYINKYGTKD